MAPFLAHQPHETPVADTATARTFSIGVLVRRFNISAESLRNWERAGLIPRAHRTPGGHRRYGGGVDCCPACLCRSIRCTCTKD